MHAFVHVKSRRDAINTSIVISSWSFVLKADIFSLVEVFMQHLAKGGSFCFYS